jgi:hypothetical protein
MLIGGARDPVVDQFHPPFQYRNRAEFARRRRQRDRLEARKRKDRDDHCEPDVVAFEVRRASAIGRPADYAVALKNPPPGMTLEYGRSMTFDEFGSTLTVDDETVPGHKEIVGGGRRAPRSRSRPLPTASPSKILSRQSFGM